MRLLRTARGAVPAESPAGPDCAVFRAAMSRFVTGVTVVTARLGAADVAMTANSFTSVSLDPLLVAISVRTSARSEAAIRESGSFVVNVLSEEQSAVAEMFAVKGRDLDDRSLLESLAHTRSPVTGSAVLHGSLAVLHCTNHQLVPAGDHLMVLGRVVDVEVDEPAPPLLFMNGRYAGLTVPQESPAADAPGPAASP